MYTGNYVSQSTDESFGYSGSVKEHDNKVEHFKDDASKIIERALVKFKNELTPKGYLHKNGSYTQPYPDVDSVMDDIRILGAELTKEIDITNNEIFKLTSEIVMCHPEFAKHYIHYFEAAI